MIVTAFIVGTILLLLSIILFIVGLILPLFFKRENRKNRTVKKIRWTLIIAPIVIIPLSLLGMYVFIMICDDRAIERVEIGSLPDNLVYFVGESDSIDLTGGTVLVITRTVPSICGCREGWNPVSEISMYRQSPHRVVYDIDFSVPGEHEIYITWLDRVRGSFTIEVIERESALE